MSSDPLPALLKLGLVFLLVLLNGFFVAAEFAMVKARSSRIDSLAGEGLQLAKFARTLIENLDSYLSACQLGITLASLGLGWLGEPTVAELLKPALAKFGFSDVVIHTISFFLAFTVITMLHITLGEQFPKTYAIRKAEHVTLLSAGPMLLFFKIMYPFIRLLNGASNWLLRRAGIEPADEYESAHTEEEIRVLMKESHKNGLIDQTELTLVEQIFEFTETNAREIMIPRTEMDCLYAYLPFEDNKQAALQKMHTRYPVCDPDKDSIIGFVHMKDLLKVPDLDDIRQIARPIISVPDLMPISSLLKLMQKQRTQIALLIDEYGGTAGLVTLEDIIEELVGEIQDEFDEERPSIERIDDETHSIDGRMRIDEVNEHFRLDIVSEDYDTIGGWIYSQIEIPPKKHQKITYQGQAEFIVEETDHMRISRIIIRKLDVQSQTA